MTVAEQEISLGPSAGKEISISITLGDQTCTFTYRTSGGSFEQWKITATDEEGTPFTCYIGRTKPPSYLVFDSFSATIKTGNIAEAEVWDNSGVTLQGDQYIIEGSAVKQAHGWGGNLALLVIRQEG